MNKCIDDPWSKKKISKIYPEREKKHTLLLSK